MSTASQAAPESRTRLDRFAQSIVHFVPDAITASVVLLIVLVIAAFTIGQAPLQVMDAYYRGLWMLLPFTMQMTLIVVLSSALAATPLLRTLIAKLAGVADTRTQVIAIAVLLNSAASYAYWGLGMALGPVIAVHFARRAERKGIRIDFPFFLATMGASLAVWQFGLSATAPLMVATKGHFLESTIGVIPLSRTIWSPAAILHVVVFTLAVIVAGCRWMPAVRRPISQFPESCRLADPPEVDDMPATNYSQWLERKPYFTWVLCAVLFGWLWHHFIAKGLGLDLNALNTSLLLLTFLLHRNFRNFASAVEKSIPACWGVIVLYHLYAGLAGLIQFTGLGERLAQLSAAVSSPYSYPALNAAIATVFSFFIPSSGGQWAIQGLVTVKSAIAVGVSPERGLLAMSVGDHMGNLTSPFWYVVIAGIARLDFRVFFGYGLLYAVIWFVIGVVVFTFAPC